MSQQNREREPRLPRNCGQGDLKLTRDGGGRMFCARMGLKSEIPNETIPALSTVGCMGFFRVPTVSRFAEEA
jgi:hypothetical protein